MEWIWENGNFGFTAPEEDETTAQGRWTRQSTGGGTEVYTRCLSNCLCPSAKCAATRHCPQGVLWVGGAVLSLSACRGPPETRRVRNVIMSDVHSAQCRSQSTFTQRT